MTKHKWTDADIKAFQKQISDKKNRKDLVNLKKTLSNLYSLEYEYHSKVLDVLGSKKKGA